MWKEIDECLDEMVTGYSRMFLDLMARIGTRMTRSGYPEGIDYDEQQLEMVRKVLSKHPVVFLPSHKSNLDHLVLQYALHENGHPPNHTAGGINMNFFPVARLPPVPGGSSSAGASRTTRSTSSCCANTSTT